MRCKSERKAAKALLFSVISALSIGASFGVNAYANEKKIPHGITIGEVEAGGLTEDELRNSVNEYVSNHFTSKNIELDVDGHEIDVTAGALGYYWKNTAVVEQAASYCQEGNVIKRYKHEKDVEKEGVNYSLEMDVNDDVLRDTLKQQCTVYNVYHVNARLTREGGTFHVSPESKGRILDVENSVSELHQYLLDDWKGEEGQKKLKMVDDYPTSTQADCAKVKDMIGTFSTTFSNSSGNYGRNKNLENGMRLLDGITMGVGETISVNSYLEPWTSSNGWYPGGTYVNGKVENTLGGGICQVSTTLYNAALNAELEIVERHCHSMTVGYVPLSMDAALAGTWKDLKIRNNTDTPIYIEGVYVPGKITFNIYGMETRTANRSVQYVSKRVGSNSSYYTSQLLKRVYLDGVLQSESVVNTSAYKNGGGSTGTRAATTQPEPETTAPETTTQPPETQQVVVIPETTQPPTEPVTQAPTTTQPVTEKPQPVTEPITTDTTEESSAAEEETTPRQPSQVPNTPMDEIPGN